MLQEAIFFTLVLLLATQGLRLELSALRDATPQARRFVWLGRALSLGAAMIGFAYAIYLYT